MEWLLLYVFIVTEIEFIFIRFLLSWCLTSLYPTFGLLKMKWTKTSMQKIENLQRTKLNYKANIIMFALFIIVVGWIFIDFMTVACNKNQSSRNSFVDLFFFFFCSSETKSGKSYDFIASECRFYRNHFGAQHKLGMLCLLFA